MYMEWPLYNMILNWCYPIFQSGQNVLISAHGNSLRALIKYLSNISDDAITELNVPTGKYD